MKKIITTVILISCAVFVLFAAGNKDKKSDVFKVAYIARAQADSFAAWMANSIVEEAKKYPDIKLQVFDGQASDDRINSMIENAIVNRFDAIIIQPNNGESQRPYAEKVVQAGMICITTNARISGINGASSVDADPFEQAAIQARAARAAVPKNGKAVILLGPPGNFHADARRESWQKEFFAKRPDVKIVGEQVANWNKDEAMKFMEDWVQANDKIDLVASMNDNMAAGAIEIIKNNKAYAETLVYGVDGTAEAVLLIKEGKMTSTTMQSAYDLATALMTTVHKLLTKQESQIDIDIDCPMVSKDNIETFIEVHKKSGAL